MLYKEKYYEICTYADVHLGTRRETPYLYDGFLNFIDYMELHPVDMIFITGDLFDHVPTKEDIMFVDTQLARLPKTDILYVTGECDYLAGTVFFGTMNLYHGRIAQLRGYS